MSGGDYAYKGDEERCPKMTARIKAVLSKKEKLNPQRVFQARGEKKKKAQIHPSDGVRIQLLPGTSKEGKGHDKKGKTTKKTKKKKCVCCAHQSVNM